MDREHLLELNKKYGNNPFFQKMLNYYLKGKFQAEIIRLETEKRRRLQNV